MTPEEWWAKVCALAEQRMMQTGKLEGSHYAAATELMPELVAAFATLEAEKAALEKRLQQVFTVGHNDECIFCGFKDRIVVEASSD